MYSGFSLKVPEIAHVNYGFFLYFLVMLARDILSVQIGYVNIVQ